MRPSDYIAILRRRWWIVLLTAAIAAATAYVVSKQFIEVLFRSEASYLVVANRLDAGLLSALRDKMNSYQSMALAPIQLEKIAGDLKLDRDADYLLKHVALQPRPEQQIIVIQVDYPDAAMAPLIANAIGDNLVAMVAQQNSANDGTDKINVVINQPARPPYLYRPQTKINVAAGALLGLILGLLLAFVLEALDDTLKTPADIERFAGLVTLGAIPHSGEPSRRRAS